MTDLVAQLKVVEEAAEKAAPESGTTWSGIRNEAEFIVAACNLPFRAVREELGAAHKLYESSRKLRNAGVRNVGSEYQEWANAAYEEWERALEESAAALCPDPAGGEG